MKINALAIIASAALLVQQNGLVSARRGGHHRGPQTCAEVQAMQDSEEHAQRQADVSELKATLQSLVSDNDLAADILTKMDEKEARMQAKIAELCEGERKLRGGFFGGRGGGGGGGGRGGPGGEREEWTCTEYCYADDIMDELEDDFEIDGIENFADVENRAAMRLYMRLYMRSIMFDDDDCPCDE